ncbi:NAD-dependent epimerase/dehydratase family protein [Bacteroidia bacterium]|mgnify:FL=1|jgi:nucleoside-diphosphate-sugar epimerase|nr:NAD-dependent epimerase/dehydratase family protein [Bacteroidia bacterium]MDA9319996.1 NAD-dependent epimerase/dehydratase family protein [bacterium]MDC0104434.1 NAD-dependent epimerase/dehydratase family protein [Bacteroidia bacterium]|tara:strand:+ start:1228 stop:2217 length:990 start_codon:yes stop_codon:yes gene_type:complete
MRVLLTGATGFLGFRTLEQLVSHNNIEYIRATGRTLRTTHYVNHPKIEYVLGDLIDKNFVDQIVKTCDVIIHAAALSSPWGSYDAFYEANVLVQKNLINAAKAHRINRFVFVSTPSLYFLLEDKLNINETENLEKNFVNAYAATKRAAEIALIQSGLKYIIIRPRALIGRGDTIILPRLIRAYDEGKLRVIGNGKNIADLTPVYNVAQALILAIFAPEVAVNQVYNISNGEPVVLWDKISAVLRRLDRTPPHTKIPFTLIKRIAQFMEWKSRITNKKEPTLTVYGVGTLAKSFSLDISKAKKLLGYKPQLSTDEAIDEFINWYRINENS